MKKEIYTYPRSSFLSVEKDSSIIIDNIMSNERLKKLLYWDRDPVKYKEESLYNTLVKESYVNPLDNRELTALESLEVLQKNIKLVPKLYIDGSVLNYIIIGFDNFTPNAYNPEFRDCILSFDIICHFQEWQLPNFQLRPYKIAAELDTMFNNEHITGIGTMQFLGTNLLILTDEFAGLTLSYYVVHGEDDKKFYPISVDNTIQSQGDTDLEDILDASVIPSNWDDSVIAYKPEQESLNKNHRRIKKQSAVTPISTEEYYQQRQAQIDKYAALISSEYDETIPSWIRKDAWEKKLMLDQEEETDG